MGRCIGPWELNWLLWRCFHFVYKIFAVALLTVNFCFEQHIFPFFMHFYFYIFPFCMYRSIYKYIMITCNTNRHSIFFLLDTLSHRKTASPLPFAVKFSSTIYRASYSKRFSPLCPPNSPSELSFCPKNGRIYGVGSCLDTYYTVAMKSRLAQ